MLENRFRYAIEFFAPGGAALGRLPVDVDWEPALEWARFQTVSDGVSSNAVYAAAASVQPLWNQEAGEPHVDGFVITLKLSSESQRSFSFPRRYFHALASGCSSRFVAAGKSASGETLQYLVVAFPELRPPDVPVFSLEVEELPVEIPIRPQLASPLNIQALGPQHPDDLPAYIPTTILENIAIQARQAGELETGGFLIGYLCRDPRSSHLFVSVTGQLPADHTHAEPTRLTFTPATWTAARSKLILRNRGEMFLGWFHSHPSFSWCRECPVENQKRCRTSKDFFSAHDILVHRTAFSNAYNLALVANVTSDGSHLGVTFSTFGWREGMVQLRGIHITANEETGTPAFQGEEHVASNTSRN